MRTTELSRILAYHAATQPKRPAFTDADGQANFRTLHRRVNRLTNALVSAGIRKGDRIALQLPNSRRHFEAVFACARLAAILVPLPADAAAGDIDAIKRDCAPALSIESEQAYEALLAPATETELAAQASADDALLIMHTSGTTGLPKGAVLTQGNILYTVFNQIIGWGLSANDRALVVAPFHHAGGLLALGLPCLHAGGSVHVTAGTPARVLDVIEREAITAVFLPPRLWTRVAGEAKLNSAKVASVRLCASGGDPIPRRVLKRLAAAFAAEFTDSYGMTETSSCLTLLRGDELLRRHGSAGRPLPYTRIKIVNTHGRDAEPNEIGEIALAGPTVMQGYWRRPLETESALRDGWFRTGDVGRIDSDGYLQVLGRRTDVIVADGAARIFPSEIETILREHPGVEEAAVTALQRAAGEETVAAWVVLRAETRLAAPDLMGYCAEMLAKEKRPRQIFFCETLPRNANGKVIKSKLREAYAVS